MEVLWMESGGLRLESCLLIVRTEWAKFCVSLFYHLYDGVTSYLKVPLL